MNHWSLIPSSHHLVKAFDAADDDLLFELLKKQGAPDPLVDVVKQLHHDFSLKFTIDENNKCDMSCSAGVRQGDNMASSCSCSSCRPFIKLWKRNVNAKGVLCHLCCHQNPMMCSHEDNSLLSPNWKMPLDAKQQSATPCSLMMVPSFLKSMMKCLNSLLQ